MNSAEPEVTFPDPPWASHTVTEATLGRLESKAFWQGSEIVGDQVASLVAAYRNSLNT